MDSSSELMERLLIRCPSTAPVPAPAVTHCSRSLCSVTPAPFSSQSVWALSRCVESASGAKALTYSEDGLEGCGPGPPRPCVCVCVCLEEVFVLIVDAVELSPLPERVPGCLVPILGFLSVTDIKTLLCVIRFLWRRSWNNPSLFVFFPQESVKVSDLNPNAKAWANHMFRLDPSGSAVTTSSALQPWKEGCDHLADPGQEGQRASACLRGFSR